MGLPTHEPLPSIPDGNSASVSVLLPLKHPGFIAGSLVSDLNGSTPVLVGLNLAPVS